MTEAEVAARVAEERAKIVAWLRREADDWSGWNDPFPSPAMLRWTADAIERGEDEEDRDAG